MPFKLIMAGKQFTEPRKELSEVWSFNGAFHLTQTWNENIGFLDMKPGLGFTRLSPLRDRDRDRERSGGEEGGGWLG